jgi:signal transduction histidine kinase/DNA-binding response OmpR family regulator/ligand-binding sensor domain-containing protein
VGNDKHAYWDNARALRSGALVLAFLVLSFHAIFAQEKLLPVFDFIRLTTADGLPNNSVTSNVVRDHQGFIWVGTGNGLARYDGYACKVYSTFRGSNNAVVLHIDTKGRLWVGTYGSGLSLFDPKGDRFVVFLPRQNDSTSLQPPNIHSIVEDESGIIWLGATGLSQAVRLDLGVARNETNPDSVAAHVRFHNIAYAGFGQAVVVVDTWDHANIVAGTDSGLFIIDCKSNAISRPVLPLLSGLNLDTVQITSLFWETPQRLWIGTRIHGLYLFDRAGGSLTAYHKRPATRSQTRDDHIQHLQGDRRGRLWIATNEGVDLFDPSSGVYQDYIPASVAPGKSEWTTISVDSKGILWIGTFGDGLYFLPPASFRFPRYALKGSSDQPMEMETIDRWGDGSYWIGAEGKVVRIRLEGLSVLKTVDLFKGEKSGSGPAGVWASCDDGKGSLWYGTWGLGLYRFEPKTGRLNNFRSTTQLSGLLVKEDVARSIICVGRDSLWIAAYNDGILNFDTRRGIYSEILHTREGSVTHLMKDRKGNIWISDAFRGLYVLDPSTMTSAHFEHDPNDPTSISSSHPQNSYQDPHDRIWIGGDVLELWQPETRSFKHFPNNTFNEATFTIPLGCDAHGRLWVRYVDRGLSILDPAGGCFTNFDYSDGVVASLAMSSLPDGRVILVGYGGMNIIDPDSLFKSPPPPPLVITKVLVNGSSNIPLQRIAPGSALRLPYDQNVLEFEFAAIDPGATHLIDYLFRLEGLEKAWIQPRGRRFVRYPGLSPGDYVFRVKAINKFGRWPDQEIALAVSISPPWWRTWWAYGVYGLLLISALYAGYRTRLRQVHLKQQAEMEHFQAEHLAEVDRLKSRFFSNISHEFRTPLTLILGPAEQGTASTEEPSSRQKFHLIRENARKLLGLVNQLLDFSRLESGMMRLQVSSGDLVPFLRRVVMSFESWAERKHIGLEFHSDVESIRGFFDGDKIEKIVNNLMSNALKFTPDGGAVVVQVSPSPPRRLTKLHEGERAREGEGVTITVSDTGAGISPDHLPHIFDRFYRVDETHTTEGTGIGLALTKELVDLHHGTITVESTLGEGSVFTVTFPIEQSAYSPNEIAESALQVEEREHAEAEDSFEEPRPVSTTAPVEGKPIVLIVEDNVDLRAYIREYLQVDYAVHEAANGKEGYDRATEIVPDLVISDIMMPQMDGIELCRALKQDVRTSHVPVILLTARAGTDSKIEGLEIGADDYVTKPFETKELGARVRNLIEQRRLLRMKFSAGVVLKPGEVAVTSLDDALLKRVMGAVEKGMSNEEFGVDDLSREVALGRRQLERKLQGLTGLSPAEFIRTMRLQRAHELLSKNAGTVSEIAFQVGFSSPSYFSSCFRERFGYPPSEVNRQHS